ncbi:glycine--tRNA ligase subunit beta [bacterium]|nr:glycine--tRNA ligase subunit beta [bacterium]
MKKDFLLEILTQELPYKFIPSAIQQLEDSFKKLFKENALCYDNIKVLATPRRLAVLVDGLVEEQDVVQKDVKGPILNIAKTQDGAYSPAAIGFAKKNNIDPSQLIEKDGYIWAHVEIKGRKTVDILKENIENLVLKLQGSHFMRWGDNTEKFSRPIEGIVALFDKEIVPIKIIDKTSSNKTQGHRYSKNRYITIDEPKNYVEILRKSNVIVNQDERRDLIIQKATQEAQKLNLSVKFENLDDLLEEVTFITEYPVVVICEFDKKYLQIPSIVTTTVMTSHQRYFPLWDKDNKLSNYFITMANYVGDEFKNIKAGNQRVITARLEDGIFFFNEDTKTKLIDKLPNLKGMTFQKGLGSLYDKTQRIIKLSEKIAQDLKLQDKTDVLRCATLSKCDLSTKLVFEFTELQGFIGENYARLDGENEIVSKMICEHYYPLSANSELPSHVVGQIVSIADKIDTICALYISTQENKKRRPTGSNDPLGARRATVGILRCIIEKNLSLNLVEIIKFSLDLLSKEFQIPLDIDILSEIKEFFLQRLTSMYEKQYNYNVLSSLLSENIFDDLANLPKKAQILTKFQGNTDFEKTKENATRISRLVKNSVQKNVDEKLFVHKQESALYSAIQAFKHNDCVEKYIENLASLNNVIIEFFDKVLVMDKDEKIKNNRLALLSCLKEKYDFVCDFEKL